MTRPRIGLIPSCENNDIARPNPSKGCLLGIERAGGEAVVIDYRATKRELKRLIDALDGFILQGGGDINPALYGEARHPACAPAFPERDALELLALETVLSRDMPLLTICRGTQVVNVFLGGTLYQDLPSELGVQHNLGTGVEIHPDHLVTMKAGSLVAAFAKSASLPTNSSHHQSVMRMGEGLVASAHAPDGVVEAIERPASRFLLGLQWHPELTLDQDAASCEFFRALLAAC